MKQLVVEWLGRRVGLLAPNDYKEFIHKCRDKFNIPECDKICVSLDDTTEVDEEYYPFIDAGATLCLCAPDSHELLVAALQRFVRCCIDQEPDVRAHLNDLLYADDHADLHAFIASLPLSSDQTALTTREQHPDWFQGVASRHRNKEMVLRGSAECRVRAYFAQLQRELRDLAAAVEAAPGSEAEAKGTNLLTPVQDHEQTIRNGTQNIRNNETGTKKVTTDVLNNKIKLKSELKEVKENNLSTISIREMCENVLEYFRRRLKSQRYQQSYFDRLAVPSSARLCNAAGVFQCGGAWDEPHCRHRHVINPYASRHHRIVFSTWNLDHVKVPQCAANAKNCSAER